MPPTSKHTLAPRRGALRAAVLFVAASVLVAGAAGQPRGPSPKPAGGPGVGPGGGGAGGARPPIPPPPFQQGINIVANQRMRTPLDAGALSGVIFPSPVNAYANATFWSAVVTQIKNVLAADPNRAPTLVRLAFHMCGTYDKNANTGGCGYSADSIWSTHARAENANLMQSLAWLDAIYFNSPPISYSDLYTLAAAVALKSTGGPSVTWRAGRVDLSGADVPATGLLPDASVGVSGTAGAQTLDSAAAAAGIRAKFGRMGFTDAETVALIGAHSLGRTHLVPVSNGFIGPWVANPTRWTNDFFTGLLNRPWDPVTLVNGNMQFQSRAQGAGNTANPNPAGPNTQMRLPSDMALRFDAGFRAIATTYAGSLATFNTAFAGAFGKLLELGAKTNLITVPVTF